jgi:hypothetical protein
MGIRRARVTWFAVINGLPAAGTGGPYHQSSSEIIPVDDWWRHCTGPASSVVTQLALTNVSAGGITPPRSTTSFCLDAV